MRNRRASLLCLVLIAAAPAAADEATPAAVVSAPDDGLAPIDLANIAPLRTELESIDAAALMSPIVCRRVRTIRSWIPREVCVTREQLAAAEQNRQARAENAIRVMREIRRSQMRNAQDGWRSRRY